MMMMPAIPAADWEAARVSSSLYSKFSGRRIRMIRVIWIITLCDGYLHVE